MYRPLKKPVTMRLDVDIIHRLKSGGTGYQTKANRLLRAEILRAMAKSAPNSSRSLGKPGVWPQPTP